MKERSYREVNDLMSQNIDWMRIIAKSSSLNLWSLIENTLRHTDPKTKEETTNFPFLSQIFRTVYAIAPSSSNVEQCFSILNFLKPDLRNRLKQSTLKALILFHEEYEDPEKEITISNSILKLYEEMRRRKSKSKSRGRNTDGTNSEDINDEDKEDGEDEEDNDEEDYREDEESNRADKEEDDERGEEEQKEYEKEDDMEGSKERKDEHEEKQESDDGVYSKENSQQTENETHNDESKEKKRLKINTSAKGSKIKVEGNEEIIKEESKVARKGRSFKRKRNS